jgi:lipid II:glycine glycyltransferase (peptidoglycan interpeptide bridge formation enzyme)
MVHVTDADDARREEWDAFVARVPTGSFLQSWQWGVFQEAAGFPVRRLMATEGNAHSDIRGTCLLIERPLPLGQRFFYAPWGPVFSKQALESADATNILHLLRQGMGGNASVPPVFLRIEPRLAPDAATHAVIEGAGFTPLRRGVQPTTTLVIDLTKSEDELLREMHPKTRYNIRLAMRHGVTVDDRTTADGLHLFLALAREVERRGTFRYHPDAYYEAMLRTLNHGDMFRVLVASHKGLPLAAALFITFGGTVTYAHGASSAKRPHVMASTLLYWDAIRRAKSCGVGRYDFFGIAPSRNPQHPWAGMTRFKRGFGGKEERTLGIADAVLDPVRYRFYTIARGLRGFLH